MDIQSRRTINECSNEEILNSELVYIGEDYYKYDELRMRKGDIVRVNHGKIYSSCESGRGKCAIIVINWKGNEVGISGEDVMTLKDFRNDLIRNILK